MVELEGSRKLLNWVSGQFKIKGSSLHHWCSQNGIANQNARTYLLGNRNGRKAKAWRRRIVDAVEEMEARYDY